jgi:hypothetical protein
MIGQVFSARRGTGGMSGGPVVRRPEVSPARGLAL